MKGISIPKGGLLPTYVLLTLLLLDMGAPGIRRYLVIDQLKDGIRYAFTPTPLVTVGAQGKAPIATPAVSNQTQPSKLTNVSCTHMLNAYTSDCQPYGQVGGGQ